MCDEFIESRIVRARQGAIFAKEVREYVKKHYEPPVPRAFFNPLSVRSKQAICCDAMPMLDEAEDLEERLAQRLSHREDGFSDYLMYLIQSKGMENAEVHKRAVVDKKLFSKIKNNPDYHPTKLTALCLCVGAQLSLDETKDLLARAGYALSPSDMTDIIFSFYIENEHYDVIDIDIMLEEYGLPCIIT